MFFPRMITFAASAATTPTGGVRFAAVAYSGGLIPALGAVIDLGTTRIANRAPVLMAGDSENVVGVVETAINDGRTLRLSGVLFSDIDAVAAEIAAKARRGTPWAMAIAVSEATEATIPAGKVATLNGREFPGPLLVLSGGLVRAASVAAIGDDPDAKLHVFAAGAPFAREIRGALVADAERRAAEVAATRGVWR